MLAPVRTPKSPAWAVLVAALACLAGCSGGPCAKMGGCEPDAGPSECDRCWAECGEAGSFDDAFYCSMQCTALCNRK